MGDLCVSFKVGNTDYSLGLVQRLHHFKQIQFKAFQNFKLIKKKLHLNYFVEVFVLEFSPNKNNERSFYLLLLTFVEVECQGERYA